MRANSEPGHPLLPATKLHNPLVPRHRSISPQKPSDTLGQGKRGEKARQGCCNRLRVDGRARDRQGHCLAGMHMVEGTTKDMATRIDDGMAEVEGVGDEARDGEDAKDGKVGVEQLVQQRRVLHPLEEKVQRGKGEASAEGHQKSVHGRQALHEALLVVFVVGIVIIVSGRAGRLPLLARLGGGRGPRERGVSAGVDGEEGCGDEVRVRGQHRRHGGEFVVDAAEASYG